MRPEAGLLDLTLLHGCYVAAWFLRRSSRKAFANTQRTFPTEGQEPSKGTFFFSLSAEAAKRKHREQYSIDKNFIYALCG